MPLPFYRTKLILYQAALRALETAAVLAHTAFRVSHSHPTHTDLPSDVFPCLRLE
jgi:hypothetical protein